MRVDVGGAYQCYPCDMSRTRVFGEPSPEMLRAHRVVLGSNETIREAIGPGVRCSHLYRLGIDILERGGLVQLNLDLGHSIGREQVHQYPYLMEADDTTLVPGMVIVVEPTIRIEGIGSIAIEDMVLVTEDGREDITILSRQLVPIA